MVIDIDRIGATGYHAVVEI